MSQIRYFVLAQGGSWTLKRDNRGMGAFPDEANAVTTALQLAAIDRVRGHRVEVLKQDGDGRWGPCGADKAARA
ncbi:MAG TPA: hypothetical protein VL460_10480 [Caulobacteraceae bacterium]|jgi:hypothetical protein|nr:hypothetical protein [Caulobacteraceae bacterium]